MCGKCASGKIAHFPQSANVWPIGRVGLRPPIFKITYNSDIPDIIFLNFIIRIGYNRYF